MAPPLTLVTVGILVIGISTSSAAIVYTNTPVHMCVTTRPLSQLIIMTITHVHLILHDNTY
jgi:hypothetical protein